MLCVRRNLGEWISITHRSGDVIRIRVNRIACGPNPAVQLACEDDARNFAIARPEAADRQGGVS